MRKGFRIALGVGLVILGIIGGFLPVIQGWMFMIPGLLILSEYFPGVKRLVEWAKSKAGIKKQGPGQGPGETSAGR
ncbi:MAG: PGPGW domain-containing protein [Bryobacteraceae bacterium]